MIGVKDLLSVLDRWDKWKRIQQAPERIDELETRLAEALEGALEPLRCKYCGSADTTIDVKYWKRVHGQKMQTMFRVCSSCNGRDRVEDVELIGDEPCGG
ncbi:hypothetical protein [Nisaea sp.]|uniref:hypothetical protein n=1 Tax=Nisaea sp. TaxID=2024842 RepID=UPI003297CEB6